MLSNLFADPAQKLQNLFRKAATCALAGSILLGVSTQNALAASRIRFSMVPSPGAAKCLRHAYGRVTLSTGGIAGVNDQLHIEVGGLPPHTGFDFFTIQVPNAPFGLAWYQGDIETDAYGVGTADFIGVFDIETFIVAPGVAPAPVVFRNPPFPRCGRKSKDRTGAHLSSRTVVWLPGLRCQSRLPGGENSF